MRTWYTADLHLGHANIIKHSRRPFATVGQMDTAIITNWNAVVQRNDRVVVVGDFAYKCDEKQLRKYFGALNGQKFLVRGNHDDGLVLGLGWVAPPQHMLFLRDGDDKVCACHYGLRTWVGAPPFGSTVHIYGHSHGRLPGNSASTDVGVDVWDFRPVSLAEIKHRMALAPSPMDGEVHDEPTGGFTL